MDDHKIRTRIIWCLALAVCSIVYAPVPAALAEEKLDIVYVHHSSAANPFWQAVKKGFDDACTKIQAKCQMIFTQNEGSIEQQVANQQAALARKPDALITTLVDDNAFVDNLKNAKAKGVMVIASNVDAIKGPAVQLREAFVGQNFIVAGTTLSKRVSALFPENGPIRVLVGVNSPGQNWSEQRAKGIINGLEEFKKANPDRHVIIDKIDVSTEGSVVSDRVGAYITAHPDTTAYFETGLWISYVARMLKERNIPPGKILLGGFDISQHVIQQMKAGYIKALVDQQPYEQGFMPVMQIYLNKEVGLLPSDIDTGNAIFTPEDADRLMALTKQGLR